MRIRVALFSLFALVLAGCTVESPEELRMANAALNIPGPWDPPASTRAMAATQYVPVVDPPTVSPEGYCTSTNAFDCSCVHPACTPALPGTVLVDQYVRNRFAGIGYGGLFCCRQNSAKTSVPRLSVHAIGRAIDLMVTLENADANNGIGDPAANFLVENAEFIGIQRVIWDKVYWNGENGFGLLSSASSSHTNHLHVEMSQAGAAQQTPFFTSGVAFGNCVAHCEGDYIVNADCTFGNCAAYGTQCLPGPPVECGIPGPPEPPEAEAIANPTLPTLVPVGAPLGFTFTSPKRLFDTRPAGDSANLTRGDGSVAGPITGAGVNTLDLSTAGLPAQSGAVWLNFAAIPLAPNGFVSAAPGGAGEPPTSNLNYHEGRVYANGAAVALGAGSAIDLYANADVELIGDLSGAFTPSGLGLQPQSPRRVLDTRSANLPLLPGETRAVAVDAPAGAEGVVAAVAVIGGPDPGFVTAFGCDQSVPATSSVNFAASTVSANTIVAPLDANGEVCFTTTKQAQLIVDVGGFLTPDASVAFQPIQNVRLLDTRQDTTPYTNRLGNKQVIELPIQSLPGVSETIWAVVANLTVIGATEAGHLTVFPCSDEVPRTSALNFGPTTSVAAVSVSGVSPEGKICIFASSRAHLIVDLQGVWVHSDNIAPPTPEEPTNPDDQGEPIESAPEPNPDSDPNTDASDTRSPTADGHVGDGSEGDAGTADQERPAAVASECSCRTVRTGDTETQGWLVWIALGLVGVLVRRRR